ncbi:hypothetical protein KY313_00495 [Candidatus Woesearchaeota archaeon]|nr:hypothetical protein [Candidatus Woesearchaeota archaeon]
MVGEDTFVNKKETALKLIREKGPIIPSQLYQEIHTDILMASALLSELTSEGKVFVSNIKFGGSPFYYMKGQEAGLERYIERLHEKEKKALMLLKQKKVLLDGKLDPVVRIALRNTKDFAKPFEAKIGERKELFWRWFLLPSEEVKELVVLLLKDKLSVKKYPDSVKQRTPAQVKRQIMPPKIKKDAFLQSIRGLFERERITYSNEKILRLNKEAEFVVKIPSALGGLSYYCKAVNKKKCSDKDLSSAFVQGQMKKLPVLFLTTGDLTNKAREMMKKEFTGMVFKQISL